jgi:uncharacterized protein YjbJ (UPF0337 family)
MGKLKGEVKEITGVITGDRRVEAKGCTEQRVADPSDPLQNVTDESVHNEEQVVRERHGDIPKTRNRRRT